MKHPTESKLFPALLKYWRGARGLSQLDLSLAADVSARHLSFLETGRSRPSREMVLRLAATLAVPLREQNALLVAAGFPAAFPEEGGPLAPRLEQALERMMEQQEPYPLLVMDRHYDLVRSNRATGRVLGCVLGARAAALSERTARNVLRLTFSPDGLRPAIANWEPVARSLLLRLHRDVLQNPADEGLAALLEELVNAPGVPEDWRTPDFGRESEPTLSVRLHCDGAELGFLTTVTAFNAPQNVTLEELHIESYFPLDDATARFCADLSE